MPPAKGRRSTGDPKQDDPLYGVFPEEIVPGHLTLESALPEEVERHDAITQENDDYGDHHHVDTHEGEREDLRQIIRDARDAEDAFDEEYQANQDARGVATEPREERWTWSREDRVSWHREALGGLVEGFTDEEVERLADQLEDQQVADDRANYDRALTDLMENEVMVDQLNEEIDALERE